MPRQLRVFLCHASQDKPAVWNMYRYLKGRGVSPWLDQADLLPGQDWEVEIPKAIYASDVILVCISKNSVNKEGYVQKEIVFALDKAMEKPQGTIFIIPVKLEECEVPDRLKRYQWVDYFREGGRKRLLMGLNMRVQGLGEDVSPVILEDTRKARPVSHPAAGHDDAEIIARQKGEEEKVEQETVERLVREKAEHEANEKAAYEKAEREKAERQTAQQLAREKEEREAAEKVAHEKAKNEEADKLVREKLNDVIAKEIIQEDTEREEAKKKILERENYSAANFRRLGIGAVILATLILGGLGLNSLFNRLPSPTITSTLSSLTKTPENLVSTNTLLPPSNIPTQLPSPTPELIISEKDEMSLAYVPAGDFIMGSENNNWDEKPEHMVYLDAIWMDQTEVTNSMYGKCVLEGYCDPPTSLSSYTHDSYYGNSAFSDYPVTFMNWNQATSYCKWAGRRLPTEAEWEKAARGIDGRTYPWGEGVGCVRANYYDVNEFCIGDITKVGLYSDSASYYGLFDMAGNVWEWVNDWYGPYQPSPSSNPQGPTSGDNRVLRGGSWSGNGYGIRSTFRDSDNPVNSTYLYGFRCAMDATP